MAGLVAWKTVVSLFCARDSDDAIESYQLQESKRGPEMASRESEAGFSGVVQWERRNVRGPRRASATGETRASAVPLAVARA